MAELFGYALRTLIVPLGWMHSILNAAGAYGAFLALFSISVIFRFLIRPFIGDAFKTGSGDSKTRGDD